MEFEAVSEQMVWEARRVAAAFEVREWDNQGESCGDLFVSTRKEDFDIRCCIDNQARLFDLHIENAEAPTTIYCDVEFQPELYCVPCIYNPRYNELMARGLYRLGLDAPALISRYPNSAPTKSSNCASPCPASSGPCSGSVSKVSRQPYADALAALFGLWDCIMIVI